MILTGKAAEYAEGFEVLDQEALKKGFEIPEMTEGDQIHLFQIMMMFERDKNFKNFMKGCLELYTEKIVEGKVALLKMLIKMKELWYD